MKQLSAAQIEKMNEEMFAQSKREFAEFREALEEGKCYLCDDKLSSFDEGAPCLHWLLRPEGFRRKHFKKLFDEYSFIRIESYLRWYANAHEPFKNINDLKDEHVGDKVKVLTVKHGVFEWSFDFSRNCVEGRHGQHVPHYHFQMKADERYLHKYNNRHIPLSEYELWWLDVEQGKIPQARIGGVQGMGMQGVIEDVASESLLQSMRYTEDVDNATYHTSSLVEFDQPTDIDIGALYKEARETGVPVHQLLQKYHKNAKTRVFIEPGPGVPKPAQRTPVRPGKKKKPSKNN